MSTPVRLGIFVLGLVVAFGAALGIGRATGPVGPIGPESGRTVAHAIDGHGTGGHGADGGHSHGSAPTGLPGGLATSQDGFTLVLEQTTYRPGTRELAFRVEDDAGAAVTAYDVEHEKLMHLVAVRRDLSGFQHVHPELDATGTWRVPLELSAGSWRIFTDFVPTGGDDLVLGTDLAVPGASDVGPRPAPSTTATVDDYEVTLAGDLRAGDTSTLMLAISQDGEPVTDLEPYLGAYGHLVALREGDLAYLHVHPVDDGTAGPTVEFGTEVPSAGRYRLFLDFQHDGVVRTVSFVAEVGHDDDQ